MEVDAIATEVEDKIQDSHYDAAWAIVRFNEALEQIATLCRIPGLQTSFPVYPLAGTTSLSPMPKTYLHSLYLVTSVTYPQGLLIAPNRKELIQIHDPEQTGSAEAVCIEGKTLLYRPILEVDEELMCYYYGKPKELAAGDSFPDYIPPTLQKEIFKNYALKEAYMDIEDGIDGVMPNTQKHSALAANAIAALVEFYPNAPKARAEVKRTRVEF
jgi:hypothetical protein